VNTRTLISGAVNSRILEVRSSDYSRTLMFGTVNETEETPPRPIISIERPDD
jgi:hypothetical protein